VNSRTSTRKAAPARSSKPNLRVERSLQRDGYRLIAGMDEVGRGALAGPVSVGVVVIDEHTRTVPQGVKDSKLLSPMARERMVPAVRRWATDFAVGHASAAEIDAVGIMIALRLAGTRALERLRVIPDLVVLDGNHDWLTDPKRDGLLALVADGPRTPPVTTLIKADMKCSSVAAASVLAKVERDGMLVEFHEDFPQYNWAGNKGYSAPDHLAALDEHGPCELHRRSWRRFTGDGGVPDAMPAGSVDEVSPEKERV
jgi:ribonuclease HII